MQARCDTLRTSLTQVEKLTGFRDFISAGIDHLVQRDRQPAALPAPDASTAHGPDTPPASTLPADTAERMKDLLLDVDRLLGKLRTGLESSEDTFSTATEDYISVA
jgi:hypothetical protein